MRLLLSIIVAMTACFSRSATANSNHVITMNEAAIVLQDKGREIKLSEKHIFTFWSRVEKLGTEAGCWIWTGSSRNFGYGEQRINNRSYAAHRLSWMMHYGPIPDVLCVLHRCDTTACMRPDHLLLGTQKDNVGDMMKKGRGSVGERHSAVLRRVAQRGEMHCFKRHPEWIPRGEGQGRSKLTESDVLSIRSRYAMGGISQAKLGKEYGVTQGCVGSIILRKHWIHI